MSHTDLLFKYTEAFSLQKEAQAKVLKTAELFYDGVVAKDEFSLAVAKLKAANKAYNDAARLYKMSSTSFDGEPLF